MNSAIEHRIFDTVINIEGPTRDALFAFLDQHLSDMLTLFIYNVMLECGLTRDPIE